MSDKKGIVCLPNNIIIGCSVPRIKKRAYRGKCHTNLEERVLFPFSISTTFDFSFILPFFFLLPFFSLLWQKLYNIRSIILKWTIHWHLVPFQYFVTTTSLKSPNVFNTPKRKAYTHWLPPTSFVSFISLQIADPW